jgi:hypothetical protein
MFPLWCPLVNAQPDSMGLVNQGREMAVPVGQHVPIDAAFGVVGTVQERPDLTADNRLPSGLHRPVVKANDEPERPHRKRR